MSQKKLSRRRFVQVCGVAAAASVSGWSNISAATKAKVVIIGGGAAGTIAAKYLAKLNPGLDISLVEKNKSYHAAFMSNQILSGTWTNDKFNFNYHKLESHGIKIINEEVNDLDLKSNSLMTKSGKKFLLIN